MLRQFKRTLQRFQAIFVISNKNPIMAYPYTSLRFTTSVRPFLHQVDPIREMETFQVLRARFHVGMAEFYRAFLLAPLRWRNQMIQQIVKTMRMMRFPDSIEQDSQDEHVTPSKFTTPNELRYGMSPVLAIREKLGRIWLMLFFRA